MPFVWKRPLGMLPSLAGVVVVTFLLSHALPGDPAAYFAGPAANAVSIAEVRAKLGLDQSLLVQFLHYLRDLAHGDLGNSLTTGQPVVSDLMQRLPASLELTLFALIVAIVVAIPMGVWAATRPDSAIDYLCRASVSVAAAFPTFFVGLLLLYLFYSLLELAPEPVGRLNGSCTRCRRASSALTPSTACSPANGRCSAGRLHNSCCRRSRLACSPWRRSPASPAPGCCRRGAAISPAPRAPAASRVSAPVHSCSSPTQFHNVVNRISLRQLADSLDLDLTCRRRRRLRLVRHRLQVVQYFVGIALGDRARRSHRAGDA